MASSSNPKAPLVALSLAAGALVVAPATARAANPEFNQADECEWPTELAYGLWVGHETGSDVRQEKSACGGVYLTNGYFATAAHCLDPDFTMGTYEHVVRFGNLVNNDNYEIEVEVEFCVKHPGGFFTEEGLYAGPDVAICRMMEQFEMSTIPILVPGTCENDYLRHQLFGVPEATDGDLYPFSPYGHGVAPVPIHVAAHGQEDDGCTLYDGGSCVNGNRRDSGSYLFHEFYRPHGGADGLGARRLPFMHSMHANNLLPNDSPLDLWADDWPVYDGLLGVLNNGDSGSPMYVQMADGSWRVIGVASYIGAHDSLFCSHGNPLSDNEHANNFTAFTPLPLFLPWMEATIAAEGDTTTDLTPCHDLAVVGGKETYVYNWSASCEEAVSHYALNPDDNDEQFSYGCTLDEGGDDDVTTRECAGWSPAPDDWAPTPPPSDAELWLRGALGSEPPQPTPGDFLTLPDGVSVYGGDANDAMTVALVANEKRLIFLGDGNDTLVTTLASGGARTNIIAGPGDDTITNLANSRDLVFPGYGRDVVDAGPGADTVVVLGGCELKTWEVYRGGAGSDTFVAPLSACALAKRGIEVSGFEFFVTTDDAATATVCLDPEALPPVQNPSHPQVAALIAAACV
ncbi:trypsin-like serine protease [Nannocystis radixulma]|uniref:Trypsin-like serine protease n=1 Tax=Nannocystis radixulma TaxID=2995305 RepID=A0ABT5AXC6_9BACT|nr:trypsin-like serine protease [Nannocystis radixulma]MDC0666476.1 trypsin-like serine protease [Nannocystis radixulma]